MLHTYIYQRLHMHIFIERWFIIVYSWSIWNGNQVPWKCGLQVKCTIILMPKAIRELLYSGQQLTYIQVHRSHEHEIWYVHRSYSIEWNVWMKNPEGSMTASSSFYEWQWCSILLLSVPSGIQRFPPDFPPNLLIWLNLDSIWLKEKCFLFD